MDGVAAARIGAAVIAGAQAHERQRYADIA
jgi:hypothetical protein